MALVLEDGTGVATADSYVSVADATLYHAAQGNTAWSAAAVTDSQREIALRRATQYMDSHYTFRGTRTKPVASQALEWPRSSYVWADVYPRIRSACCELALRALDAALVVDQTTQAVIGEKVGEIDIKYAAPQFGGQTRYAIVDKLIAPLTSGGGGLSIRVDRA